LYRRLLNTADSSEWVRFKESYLTNLETGWYLLYAQNRDDAMTPSIPALGYLSVFEPTWIRHPERTKEILIANHSYFPPDGFPIPFRAGDLSITYSDSVKNFYINLVQTYLTENSYPADDFDWVDYTISSTRAELSVPKSDLYNHRLVIVSNIDMSRALKEEAGISQETPYSLYMDVGGMVWVVGRRSFDSPTALVNNFGPSGDHSIAFTHFNLSAEYSQDMTRYNQAEFAGTSSLISGFPNLSVDTIKVAYSNWGIRRGTDTTWYRYSHGLIGVDILARFNDNSETIYRFSAVNPDTSEFHNFPVAVRYDKGTYKTACFTFPLYFIHSDQAMEVTRQMLNWFFDR
jgi:hypothetical protein